MIYAALKWRVGDKRFKKELGFVDPANGYAFLLKEAELLPEDAVDVEAFMDRKPVVL